MKTYQVFLKPCEQFPEGSLCIDPSYIHQDKEDKDGYAVFYEKKSAQKLIDYLCSVEWAADFVPRASNKQEDYKIVCSHDVRYCVWHLHSMQPCGDVIGGGYGGNTFIAKTKKEAKKALNSWLEEVGFPSEDYAIAQILIPKKKAA
jgi:hypothetical protein